MTDTELVPAKNIGESVCLTYQADFERALGYELISGALAFEPFLMAVKEDVLNSPKLAEAFEASMGTAISSLLLAAQCKLLPGSKYDLFYLIPRWSSRRRCLEVTPLIGYKGLTAMTQRHERVHKVEAHCVYEGEEFDWDRGSGKLHHPWRFDVDRSDDKLVGAYSRIVITEPGNQHPVMDDPIIWTMSREEILKRREESESWQRAEKNSKRDSFWHKWAANAFRKTVLRGSLNNGAVPRDMGLGGVIAQDDAADLSSPPPELPKVSVQAGLRQELGIDDKPAEPFEFAEEAVEAILAATTKDAVDALLPRVQHFQGGDADQVALAVEARLELLEGD